MNDEKNSSPSDESPDMTAGNTGQSAQLPVESGADEPEDSSEPMGQSSEAPATG